MPRRRITNESDAANLVADCAVKAARGEIAAHQLHAITSAMATYGNLLKARRQEQLAREIRDQVDELFGDNKGAALHFKRKLTPVSR
jgi:hypothetical protein